MAVDPVSLGVAAGVNLLAPVVAKGIGGLFGLDEPSEEERRAAARRQEAIDRLTAEAEGRTASPAQLAALAQQQRTQQALASLAQRGTVQQRAGNVRAAMQAAPEVMAQQGAVAAQTRAEEMARARNALAQAQMGVATQEAAQGAARREYMQRLVGAGIQGAAGVAGEAFTRSPTDQTPANKLSETEAQAYNAEQAALRGPGGQARYQTGGTTADAGAAFQANNERLQREAQRASGQPLALGGFEPIATGVQAAGRQALQLGTSIPKIGASFLQRLGTPRGMRGM